MSGRELFGTDGVRGVANAELLTPELALALGRAVGERLGPGSRILVGRDTRLSGPMLEGAIVAGLASAGCHVTVGGVLPTPAVAELVAADPGLTAGVVLSASHNPFADNGIKLFGDDGFKLGDAVELEIEATLAAGGGPRPTGGDLGRVERWHGAAQAYVDLLLERMTLDLAGRRIAIDCANGATVTTARRALERLGATVSAIGDGPDGININDRCGSTHLDALRDFVLETGHDVGLAFDGDGDRVMAIAGDGALVDGDRMLALLAVDLRDRGVLAHNVVVTTTMANLGFRKAMTAAGIDVRLTDVGDRYVLAEMRDGGFVLGGEQSGHILNMTHGPTGDGLAAGLQVLAAIGARGQSLAEAATIVQPLPQLLVNVRVARKEGLPGAEGVWREVAAFESAFGDDGRAVVRPSGTEQLVRVMIEAPTADDCKHWCERIAAEAAQALGG